MLLRKQTYRETYRKLRTETWKHTVKHGLCVDNVSFLVPCTRPSLETYRETYRTNTHKFCEVLNIS
jgi:hypothetical protein